MPTSDDREGAKNFLRGLQKYLNERLKSDAVRRKLHEYAATVKRDKPNLKDVSHEALFSNNLVVPAIHEHLSSLVSDARQALLAEGYANFRQMASGSPASSLRFPFTKQFSAVGKIVQSWWNGSGESIQNACPDFALHAPSPYTVVGEAKYFRKGGVEAAKTELVRGVFQCFYYRGLPRIPGNKSRPAWDYDYACLLAYDASENGSLVKAWEAVDPKVKVACWEGANIFVMVLPLA